MMPATIPWQNDSLGQWPDQLPALTIDAAKTALVVVDVQNYGSFDKRSRVIENSLRLLNFFRHRGLPVFFLRVGSLLPDASDVHTKRRISWHRRADDPEEYRCPKGSWAFDVRPELAPLATEMVLDKNSSGAFNCTAMDHYLSNMGMQNLVITGVSTHACVENTARDASDRGYNVILVDDACGSSRAETHARTMRMFVRIYGSVKSTDQMLEILQTALGSVIPNG